MKRFKLSTEVLFSEDAINALYDVKDVNAVLITDKFMVDSGMADMILKKLSNCKSVSVFSEVIPDPPMDLIERGIAFLDDKDCDVVVALGGGSSIDAAKAIVYMARKIELELDPTSTKRMKLIALPTTSGTGSEVTQFAVVTDSKTGVKIPLIDESLMPDIAILDPELVKSAPPFITADTGMDVITHALEAYVSETASDCSDCLAEKALELAFEYLPRAYRNGYDIKARDKMHRASCLAGMAFSLVNLGLNHGIAHALGAIFHIPHGRANALVLPYVIAFNADVAREGAKHSNDSAKKYQKVARIVGLPASTPKVGVSNLIAEINRLLKYMDRPMCITECGVSLEEFEAQREEIIRRALADACTVANPRKVVAEDISKILDNIAK
ncbi:MAG: iron-containing alcohol dehydrogenase [Lachnospiraceae bacterium]|nr:iron-containing alcohol dehydrogenase [Lachnospiraceae bacterium]